MNHFWRDVPGFFTWPEYYKWVADEARKLDSWHGVEVGCYHGQSAAYLAVELGESYKFRLDLVDVELSKHDTPGYLRPYGGAINYLEMDSAEAAKLYDDGCLDFCFIDADHSYASVRRDIDAWLPKVRKGGIIAGHDHCPDFVGVIQAVSETFPHYEVWRGERGPGWGDQRMVNTGQYYAVWSVRV